MTKKTYAADVEFLRKYTEIIELTAGDAALAVAPGYQARVMTSCLAGPDSQGFGWLNDRFIAAGKDDPRFNNYGGEDRFWIGPEAGQYSFWFRDGEPFDPAHWMTPTGVNSGAWKVAKKSSSSATMSNTFKLVNYSGASFHCQVTRTINALTSGKATSLLGADVPEGVKMVGFESVNKLTNAGTNDWTRSTGLMSIWILGQFQPLPKGKVIVPFLAGDDASLGPKATTDYFGPIPTDRCTVGDYQLLLSCDGRFRCKIGISPARAKDVLGSYDPQTKVLTIVQFSLPAGAADLPYVNSLWKIQSPHEAFAGDVVNSYNDGEVRPGDGQLGPFYEIETSSPAAELQAGRSIAHTHRTFHFTGKENNLNDLSQKVLGFDLNNI